MSIKKIVDSLEPEERIRHYSLIKECKERYEMSDLYATPENIKRLTGAYIILRDAVVENLQLQQERLIKEVHVLYLKTLQDGYRVLH